MDKKIIGFSTCLVISLLAGLAMAQAIPVAEFVDPDGPTVNFRSVEERDGYVYACRRDGTLFVFDTRESLFSWDGTPGEFTELITFDSPIQTIKLSGYAINCLVRYRETLYALGSSGIEILDLTDPASPVLTGNEVFTQAFNNLRIYNGYLITCGRSFVEVFSLDDQTHPTKVASYESPDGFPLSVAGYRDLIFVAESGPSGEETSYLKILDFSDHENLTEMKRITYPHRNTAFQLRVIGENLIESSSSNIRVRTLGPSGLNPVLLIEQQSSGRACAVAGNYIVTNGRLFRIYQNELEEFATFSPGQTQHDGVPHGSVIRHDIAFITQKERVLAVRYVSPPVLVFPQLAWGSGVVTEIFLSNPGTSTVTGKLLFKSSTGEPVAVSIGGDTRYSLSFSLLPGAVFKTKTDNAGVLQVGYAVVVADPFDSEINGIIGYNLDGNEVSVPHAVLSDQYHVSIERDVLSNSGIAIANPGLVGAVIDAMLVEKDGTVFSTLTLDLEAGEKTAKFINELFVNVPESFQGSFHLHSSASVALSGFRQKSTGALLSLSGAPTALEPPAE